MSKLIERLDEWKSFSEESHSAKEDYSYYLRLAYPKLRAVVEAARKLEMYIGSSLAGKGSYKDEQDAFIQLGRALAALEEDVCP